MSQKTKIYAYVESQCILPINTDGGEQNHSTNGVLKRQFNGISAIEVKYKNVCRINNSSYKRIKYQMLNF